MTPKILLVDDKLENILALEETLANLEVEYIRALSGKEALRHVLKHEFALLIIDVQMSEMDGYQTVEFLRQSGEHKHLPVIFISAIYSEDYYKIKGIEIGAIDFIVKPFAPEILRGKVHQFLELYSYKMELIDRNRQLQEANAALESLVKKNQMGIMVVDLQGIVLFLNPAMQNLLGYRGHLLVGQPFGIPIINKNRFEIKIVRKNAEIGTAELSVAKTVWEQKQAYLVMLYDITERKRAEIGQ